VTLHAAASELIERWPHMRRGLQAVDESSSEYRTSDESLDWLAMRIGMLGVDFDVHEPPELVMRMSELAARFARAAG
jgi:predicted DNA-binding transcriptional regulator YafY